MSFVLFGTVSQCCDATSILDGIIWLRAGTRCNCILMKMIGTNVILPYNYI